MAEQSYKLQKGWKKERGKSLDKEEGRESDKERETERDSIAQFRGSVLLG